jgi:serralysin
MITKLLGSNRKVVIYSGSEYQGISQELEPGSYNLDKLTIGNDTLSSLRVPSGMRVILYEHAGFTGRSKEFTKDTPQVGDDFNDKTSSLEIFFA